MTMTVESNPDGKERAGPPDWESRAEGPIPTGTCTGTRYVPGESSEAAGTEVEVGLSGAAVARTRPLCYQPAVAHTNIMTLDATIHRFLDERPAKRSEDGLGAGRLGWASNCRAFSLRARVICA